MILVRTNIIPQCYISQRIIVGLLVWGGENFELSFKVWQCGGSVVWVPCSRVGHVYRAFMPYGFGKLTEKAKGPIITINYKRVVEVWMDEEYKQYFYTREPTARYADMGNITAQLALKKELECKSFDWFMKNIAYDMLEKFPKLPENIQLGSLINIGSKTCLDTLGRSAPAQMGVTECYGEGNGQLMRLNAEGQLGIGERCVDATSTGAKLIFCPSGTVKGPWDYDEDTKLLMHAKSKRYASLLYISMAAAQQATVKIMSILLCVFAVLYDGIRTFHQSF